MVNVRTTTAPSRLRLFRQEACFTQAELARRVGLSRGTIAKVEAGHEPPWPKLRRDVVEVLGFDEDMIFPGYPR